jgi:hypothetical protein
MGAGAGKAGSRRQWFWLGSVVAVAVLVAALAASSHAGPGEDVPAGVSGDGGDPPQTTITEAPEANMKTRKRKKRVRFAFASSELGSVFRCEMDNGHGTACSSPYRRRVRQGLHLFEVQAIDAGGHADPTPATYQFKVKRKR